MEDLQTSYFINQYPTFVAIFVILVIVIAVLSLVLIIQNRKQAALKPQYGFLGKPIAVMFFLVLAVGSISLVYYSTQNSQDVGNVSADRTLNLEIKSTYLSGNSYRLNVIPSINDTLWGNGDTFNAYWTISNTSSFTRAELDLSKNSQGGIVIDLASGKNIIKVIVFTGDISKELTKEILL